MNPETAPITKTPEGKIKARFLHFGRSSASVKYVLVKSKSLVTVKKNIDDAFEEIQKVKGKMNFESEGVEFIIHTRSKYGLDKKIHITQKNFNIGYFHLIKIHLSYPLCLNLQDTLKKYFQAYLI